MNFPAYTAPPKDPADIEDYGLICTPWLGDGETVSLQSVVADSPDIIISGVTTVDGVVRWRVSGGLHGQNYALTVHVTSSAGRRAERTVVIPVRDR